MKIKKPKSSAPKKSSAKKSGGSRREASLDRALADYEKHSKKVEHHRNQRDLAEAKIRVAGHEVRHVYPGEKMPTPSAKPKVKVVKVNAE